jgi:hypothetical protein
MVSIELLVVLFRYGLHISNTSSLSMPLSARIGGGYVRAGDLPSLRVLRKRPSGGYNEEVRQVDVGLGTMIRGSGDHGIEGRLGYLAQVASQADELVEVGRQRPVEAGHSSDHGPSPVSRPRPRNNPPAMIWA